MSIGGKYTSTKTFRDLPCAHRQHAHEGNCKYLHGYSREVTLYFTCNELDKNHFVVDFSALKKIREWLEDLFDHTTLINEDDPLRPLFWAMAEEGALRLRVLPNVSMEASAAYVFDHVAKEIQKMTDGRAWLYRVEMRENEKNSAIYEKT